MTHTARRAKLLRDYPQVKTLSGIDRRSKYLAFLYATLHLSVASVARNEERVVYIVMLAWLIGAPLSQALFLAIHELSHNLFFVALALSNLFVNTREQHTLHSNKFVK